jgi:hypothetical protein
MRVWTLSNPASMEDMARKPGNKQAPGAIVFLTKDEAEVFIETNGWRSRQPYELEMDGPFGEHVTRSGSTAQAAYHLWHTQLGKKRSLKCGMCMGWKPTKELSADALLVEASIINPDTGEPA